MKEQAVWLRLPLALPFGGKVGEADGPPRLDGGADGLNLGGQAGLVPGGQVDEHVGPAGYQPPRPRRQLLHELGIAPGAADAVQAAQTRQDGLHLRAGEQGAVHPIALQDGNAAAGALGGDQGDARPAQGVDVPLDGPPRDLEPFRQLRRSDLLPLEQEGENADEPVQFHVLTSFLPQVPGAPGTPSVRPLYHSRQESSCPVFPRRPGRRSTLRRLPPGVPSGIMASV